MAITTNAICNSFKKELLQGKHDFDTSSDTYKLAMYTSSATLGKSTENYTTSNEVSSSGYTAGGKALVNQGVKVSSSIAITDFADLSFVVGLCFLPAYLSFIVGVSFVFAFIYFLLICMFIFCC